MILISDAHVGDTNGNTTTFFDMLDALAHTTEDVVFLGDIFELWFALPHHESELHERFLGWCKEQKARRSIGFIEGNHEFYVAQERQDWFSWCAELDWRDEQNRLFVHGDRISDDDQNAGSRRLRRVVTGGVLEWALRHVPGAPRIAAAVQKALRRTGEGGERYVPEDIVRAYADARFREGISTAFVGHFHRDYEYVPAEGKALYVLPGWLGTGQIARYDPANGSLTSGHWRALLES